MTESRNWKALKKTGVITVDGVDLELRKRGVKRIISDVTAVPLLGDAIELVVERSLAAKGKTDFGALIKDAILDAAERTGGSSGKVARDFLTTLPDVITDVFVADVVLASEAEKIDFAIGSRAWARP
ncbi:hypothetical protein [Methylobacterium sp. WL19]|uniref:hypothetical protein n=1 Tax=Methylobacterium sp. WL19 TaxID=2603896 RepID=UPI0011CB65A1|nr:hypothetical protein [Methylobacterium sp. WL19]TXN30819.1 hypothetical protein FV220_05975 [Methylobacterium sp. WL19]